MLKKFAFLTGIVFASTSLAQTTSGHTSRYIFSPSGFGLEKDRAYLNVYGPMIDLQYGLTDNIAIGFGTPYFLGVYGSVSYWTKINDKVYFKTGLLAGFPSLSEGYGVFPFAVGTYGTPDNQLSLGVGYVRIETYNFDLNGPSINIGGYHKIQKVSGFVYDSWYLPQEETAIIASSIRLYTKKNKMHWNIGVASIWQNRRRPYNLLLGYDWGRPNQGNLRDGIVDGPNPNPDPSVYSEPIYLRTTWKQWEHSFIPTITFAAYL